MAFEALESAWARERITQNATGPFIGEKTKPKGLAKPTDIYIADREAEASRIDPILTGDDSMPIRKEFAAKRLANEVQSPGVLKAVEDRKRAEAKLQQANEREQQELALIGKWGGLLSQWEQLMAELENGEQQKAALLRYKERMETTVFLAWGGSAANQHALGSAPNMATWFSYSAGCNLALEQFPLWHEQHKRKIAEVEAEMVEFANAHKITDHLPDHLKP